MVWLKEETANQKILVVGAGGIGCELLKNLILAGKNFQQSFLYGELYIILKEYKNMRAFDFFQLLIKNMFNGKMVFSDISRRCLKTLIALLG